MSEPPRRLLLAPREPREEWHGTPYGYGRKKCKCSACLKAGRAYARKSQLRRRARGRTVEYTGDEPWHGTLGGYSNHGCKCDRCRAANRRHMRDYREGKAGPGAKGKVCSQDGCDDPQYARGYCRAHYTRMLYGGNMNTPRRHWTDEQRAAVRIEDAA